MAITVKHSKVSTIPDDADTSLVRPSDWNADHTLVGTIDIANGGTGATTASDARTNLGLGTIATQNANSVTVTGGTINGTTIGATTATTGKFTTLEATGNADLGTSSANYVDVAGSATNPVISVMGSSTNAGLDITGKGSGAVVIKNNGGTVLRVRGDIVNPTTFYDIFGSTGSAPILRSTGNTANFQVTTGNFQFQSTTAGTQQFLISHTASAVNYPQVTGGATGVAPVLSAQGSDTNIPLVLQPKGTGALQSQLTDSTATGGNARGANAVDWQTSRNAATQVASGQQATVVGGNANTASSTYTVVAGGNFNNASGFGSAILGGNANVSSQSYTFVGGGDGNVASGSRAIVVGGNSNTAGGYFNFIGGGVTNSATSGTAVTTQAAATNGVTSGSTAVTLAASNASIRVGQLITGTGIVSFTYVAAISGTTLTLSQNANATGTPTLSFFTPHGVVVGGGNNQATGSYSFIGGGGDAGTASNRNLASGDWSTVSGGRGNQATGGGSVIAGGGTDGSNAFPNTATSTICTVSGGFLNNATAYGAVIVGGGQNTSNGVYSTILGGVQGTARGIVGNAVFSATNTPVANASGVSQSALLVLGTQTTDATATILRSNTSAAGTTNQVILPNNSAYYFKGEVIAGVTGGGNTKGFTIEGVIKRGANAAATTLVGSTVMSAYGDAGAATWTVALAADTTNGGLRITVTGALATTIRWVAKVQTTEMTF